LKGVPQQGEEEEECVIIILVHLCEANTGYNMYHGILVMYASATQDYLKKRPSHHHYIWDSSFPLFKSCLNMFIKPLGLETRARYFKARTGTPNTTMQSL
jgi:hypothetical protein